MISIEPIPAFSDNYLWLLVDDQTRRAAVVDPGDAAPVERRLREKGLELAAILITHHHPDHIGGVNALNARRQVPVIGPASDNIPQITQVLRADDHFSVLGIEFSVIPVPGHTLDHIALFTDQSGDHPALFCGDTLFAGGCGRIFEGDPKMMFESLRRLTALPADTRVYCAHEYTLANLAFAQAVEPDNRALQQRVAEAKDLRRQNRPTVPSTLELELATNPFLRCHLPGVQQSAHARDGGSSRDNWEVFATVRGWKDNFQ